MDAMWIVCALRHSRAHKLAISASPAMGVRDNCCFTIPQPTNENRRVCREKHTNQPRLPRSPRRTGEIEAATAPLPGTDRRSWDHEARRQLAGESIFDV
ncbi:polypeptide N-acetylgalactosaminyltransferase 15-like protein [Lates japonicus]|uniref:Polypeptide N-acetylgalactosaminyltransferase 15-like protein n=1 Tax=Lates japonicus TaxID=270547 RepID=A0AAD3R6Y8_LATJO|nr:polypeptide N-acetylgalactosaminyltransferase 15-like protein [Lates japonicus]